MTGLRAAACLSLSGRFAPFGVQAERGLRLWAEDFGVNLVVADDKSDAAVLAERLPGIARDADLLLGPYSTVLARAAIAYVQAQGRLLFNHGGSGGKLDVPGHVVNILTPADRYAEPFVRSLRATEGVPLYAVTGKGAFGRDVIAGAGHVAQDMGIDPDTLDFDAPPSGTWDLISAGVYEDDVANVRRARALPNPPWHLCSVAAGVASFGHDVGDPDGIYGVGQWAAGVGGTVDVGLDEERFLTAWSDRYGGVPDYPGVQAYAAGVIASEAARVAGSTAPRALWDAVTCMDVRTVFGRFHIDPATGVQTGHDAVLTQWSGGTSRPV